MFWKRKHTVEELNRINQERWAKSDPVEEDIIDFKIFLKRTGVDDSIIEDILSRHHDGKNIDEKGNEYWVCGCSSFKFSTKEEYIMHHYRVHS